MRRVASSIVMLAVLVTPSMAFAQAGDGQIKAAAKAGERVSVVDDAGRKVEGRVEAWSEEAVRLSIRGASQEIPIDRIVRIDKPDSLKNGALTGLGVGLGLGFLGAALTQGENAAPGWAVWSVVSNGVACTLLGVGIDAIFNNRRTLYERGWRPQARLSPVVGRGVRGAAVSLTW